MEPGGEDLLSKLPSDVLVSILEKLELREAIRAGVLSSRWRCLPKQLPRLALDINNFLPVGQEYEDHDNGEDEAPADDGYRDVLSEAGNKIVDVAAALLAARAAGDVDVRQAAILAVSFHLRHSYYMSLGRLLEDAVATGKVHAAELKITSKMHIWVEESTERFLALLRGYGRRFRTLLDAFPAAFGALPKLTIEKVKLRKADLDDILDTCTRLEDLSLYRCVPGPRGVWQVRHARLTNMKISLCGIQSVSLEWLPKLERFAVQGWYSITSDDLVSFGHFPRLTTVTLSHDNAYGNETLKLSRILPNTALKDLGLNFRGSNIWVQPETSRRLTDVFRNLKNLKIRNVHRECGLSWTMFLLQNAPHLQELYIKLTDHDCGVAMKNVPWKPATSFKHYSLTRVTILGFYSTEETIVAYIRSLIQAAINLKEMHMRENATFCVICGHEEPQAGSWFPRTDQEKDTFTKRITNGTSATFKTYIQS